MTRRTKKPGPPTTSPAMIRRETPAIASGTRPPRTGPASSSRLPDAFQGFLWSVRARIVAEKSGRHPLRLAPPNGTAATERRSSRSRGRMASPCYVPASASTALRATANAAPRSTALRQPATRPRWSSARQPQWSGKNSVMSSQLAVLDATKRIVCHGSVGSCVRFRPRRPRLTASNASAVLFDELHAQPNRDLYDVLRTSQGHGSSRCLSRLPRPGLTVIASAGRFGSTLAKYATGSSEIRISPVIYELGTGDLEGNGDVAAGDRLWRIDQRGVPCGSYEAAVALIGL